MLCYIYLYGEIERIAQMMLIRQRRRQDFGSGANILGVGLVGGTGGGAPRTRENFRKFAKEFLKKITINAQF